MESQRDEYLNMSINDLVRILIHQKKRMEELQKEREKHKKIAEEATKKMEIYIENAEFEMQALQDQITEMGEKM